MNAGVVIPVGPNREENLTQVLSCLQLQTTPPAAIVIVEDGEALRGGQIHGMPIGQFAQVTMPKHEPGMEQPRNVGVRVLKENWPDVTHVWFLDTDVLVGEDCLEDLGDALERGPENRIVVAPYDWMGPGSRAPQPELYNDPRWPMFRASPAEKVYMEDLSAGLACFSGNLMWPISEFQRVGGFWNELHHGRCEDGELGARAVAMGVGISLASLARGWHMYHEMNPELTEQRNARDVPMLNARHPWIEGSAVFMVDRDGKAFDTLCPKCGGSVTTAGWWAHAADCGVAMTIPANLGLESRDKEALELHARAPAWVCVGCGTEDEALRYDNGDACERCVMDSFAEYG